jgi:hypothetical protein
MRYGRSLTVLLLLATAAGGLLMGAAAVPDRPQHAQAAPAQWTVLFYIAADNNLESYALADFNEMEFTGSTPGVNVVVQIDRADGYDASNGNWTGARRYFVTQDTSLTKIGSQELDDIGETNTGDPATLVDFATWAINAYPADRYALILWDHGGSWLGVANDNSADGDGLTLPELDSALSQIVQTTGIGQFEMIGFDACLMGSLEVYSAIAPYARYGVGSADLIPGNGWDYVGMLDALAADPTIQGDALGRAIVDSFMTYYTEVTTQYKVFNLALVDLTQTGAVVQSLDQLAGTVQDAPLTALAPLVLARSQTRLFGAFDDPRFVDTWAAADLLGFLDRLAQDTSGGALLSAAQNAYEAGAGMIVYYRGSTDPALVKPGGVSIYFPRNARLFQTDLAARYDAEAPPDLVTRWSGFLNTFFETTKDEADPKALTGKVDSVTANGNRADVAVSVDPTKANLSTLLVELQAGPEQQIAVAYQPLTAGDPVAWDGRVPWLSDGTSELPVLVLRDAHYPDVGIVNGRVYLHDGAPVEVQLVFDLTTNQLTSVWSLTPTANGLMPSEIAPQPGDIFHPLWITPTPGGRLSAIPASEELPFSAQPFSLVWKRAPVGEYDVRLHVQDIAGNNAGDHTTLAITANTDHTLALSVFDPRQPDSDGDGIPNRKDNCPALSNPDQADADGDGLGDACDQFDDTDPDGDGIPSGEDDCPALYDPAQDAPCSWIADFDGDGIPDDLDLCAGDANAFQSDQDWDGIGDACDPQNAYDPADDYLFGLGDYGDYYGGYGEYSGYGDTYGGYGETYGEYSSTGETYGGSGDYSGEYTGGGSDSAGGGDYTGGSNDYAGGSSDY